MILLSSSRFLAANIEPCLKQTEAKRQNLLQALSRIENAFRDSRWHHRKYQELLYRDLWEAVQQKNARFSNKLRAEGEVLYLRLRTEADLVKSSAESANQELLHHLATLEQLPLSHKDACFDPYPASAKLTEKQITSYGNCADIWNHESLDIVLRLKKTLLRYLKSQEKLTEKVEDHMAIDSQSDHGDFYDRFAEDLWLLEGTVTTRVLARLHELRPKLESAWPGDKCCAFCSVDQALGYDPVLNQVKPDPQGEKGVAGAVVNQTGLLEAFEEMELRKESN